jgi:hypothetical protein
MDHDLNDADFGWLEGALSRIGARPLREGGHRRWSADGVKIDLLCDRYPNEYEGEVDLPGAPATTAMQLPGPAAVFADVLAGPLDPADPTSPHLRSAGRGGYLLAKAGAPCSRWSAKDLWDVWWVVLHGDGGPRGAADAMVKPALAVHYARNEPLSRR